MEQKMRFIFSQSQSMNVNDIFFLMVPKLLLHRIFPNARYSLWIDGKLELMVDPYQVIERFLWRNNASFAISRHYSRFDVFEEVEANKVAGKYDSSSIDYQIDFYRNEGLTHISPAKYPITSGPLAAGFVCSAQAASSCVN